jgi:hypothetical protein
MTPGGGEIALFPLQTVLFPGGLLPLRIFEQRYMDMAKECLKSDAAFGVCLIRKGAEVGDPATPEEVGCLARIVQWDMQQLGLLHVTVRGERRFKIVERHVERSGLSRARVQMLEEESDATVPARFAACRRLIELVVQQRGADLFAAPLRLDSSAWLSARLSEILPVPLAAKQKLMELDDSVQRLEILQKFLEQHGLTGDR